MLYTATIRRHFNCSYYPGRRAAVAAPYCSLPSLRSVHSRKSTRYLNCPQLSHDNHRLSHTHKKNLSFFFYCGAQGRISFIALVFWPFLIDTPSDDRLASRNLFSFFSHPISPLHKSIRRRFFFCCFSLCVWTKRGRPREKSTSWWFRQRNKKETNHVASPLYNIIIIICVCAVIKHRTALGTKLFLSHVFPFHFQIIAPVVAAPLNSINSVWKLKTKKKERKEKKNC